MVEPLIHVSAVVFRDVNDKVLTVRKRGTEKFMFPGGKPELGESALDTAIREVKEEIGQDVESLEFIRSYPYEKREMLMLGYKATVRKKDFKLSGEVDSVEWVKYENALSLLREGSIGWQLVKAVIER